jgi:hypothetical protein
MSELKRVIMQRDGISEAEADDLIDEAKKEVMAGADPEEVLEEMFGLEPDYIFDLLD